MSFPSLVISADTLLPQGAFAEAQARYLYPDPDAINELEELLSATNTGIVAHFYMDVELQGILSALSWPHVYIADSLMMADAAVNMAKAGVSQIIVLGVDFMSENVRAVMDASGYGSVPVYRVDKREIGCSLAESAEALAYGAWLDKASTSVNPLHVIYINTSLQVKARAHRKVPTITCTSSNVLQTILQAFSQIEDLSIWYGPDTYMGANLDVIFNRMSQMSDEEIAAVHPAHNRQTIQALRARFEYFRQGNCVVHHMFGQEVVETVQRDYPDAFHTAHLEVPGEMFELAVTAQAKGRGVVGSTSNILNFIGDKVQESLQAGKTDQLTFVLGTEAGMITAIVRKVQAMLPAESDLSVKIVFPVASDAVAQDDQFGILPGVAGGEGCSTAGGCATCPYMKMNSLDSMVDLLMQIQQSSTGLDVYWPKLYSETIDGRTIADLGGEPILFMRHFQANGDMDSKLVEMVLD